MIYYIPYISYSVQLKNRSLFKNLTRTDNTIELKQNEKDGNEFKNINLKKDYPELYQAFKNSDRLIE